MYVNRIAAVVAVNFSVAVGMAAAAPAQAAPSLQMTTHINMHPVAGTLVGGHYFDQWVVDINGLVRMSQAAASDAISHGYTIQLRYWGDDAVSDDLLYGPVRPRTVFAASDGLHFQHYVTLPHFLLDEDSDSVADLSYGRDEIYVGSRLVDANGRTVSSAESNRYVDKL